MHTGEHKRYKLDKCHRKFLFHLPSILSASTLKPSSLVISNLRWGCSLLAGQSSSSSDGDISSSEADAAPYKTHHTAWFYTLFFIISVIVSKSLGLTCEYQSISSSLWDCCATPVPMLAVCLVHPGTYNSKVLIWKIRFTIFKTQIMTYLICFFLC